MSRSASPQAPARPGDTKAIALGAFVTAALTLLFFSLFWNRFVGFRSGDGSFTGGSAMLAGIYPYRDYFTAATPLNAIKAWAVLGIFGNTIAALRAFDILERTALGLLVYFWLARLFRVRDAAVAAIVTIVISACDYADPVSSYNHDAIIWAVAAGFAANFVFGRRLPAWAFTLAAISSGLLSGLSFDTKQTIGLGATVAIPFVVALCLLRIEGFRRACLFIALFVAGWCLSAGLLVLWLMSIHILPEFLQQVFIKGPAAKASKPIDFATRFLRVTTSAWWAVVPAILALAFSIRAIFQASDPETPPPAPAERSRLGLILLAGALALSLGALAAYAGVRRVPIGKPPIFFSLYATALLLIYYALLYLRRALSRRESQCCLLAAVSFACAVMLSLSWPAFEAMTVPALAFPIAAVLHIMQGWRKPLIYAVCTLLVFGAALQKMDKPFGFDDFAEPPVRTATMYSTLPELRGFRLPESSVRLLDETVRIVREHSSPDDKIFVFPEIGLFYGLTHRRAPTATSSHNIDVVNDEFARSEAQRLLAAPPAVIIYYRQEESILAGNESSWRNGRRSGQRDIIAAIETLVSHYRLAAAFDVPPNTFQVMVYVRNEPPSPPLPSHMPQ
jgi:hypothetical protein